MDLVLRKTSIRTGEFGVNGNDSNDDCLIYVLNLVEEYLKSSGPEKLTIEVIHRKICH